MVRGVGAWVELVPVALCHLDRLAAVCHGADVDLPGCRTRNPLQK
jgi:hypothetical protein